MQKERRRLTVFRLGALAGSLLTPQYNSRRDRSLSRSCRKYVATVTKLSLEQSWRFNTATH